MFIYVYLLFLSPTVSLVVHAFFCQWVLTCFDISVKKVLVNHYLLKVNIFSDLILFCTGSCIFFCVCARLTYTYATGRLSAIETRKRESGRINESWFSQRIPWLVNATRNNFVSMRRGGETFRDVLLRKKSPRILEYLSFFHPRKIDNK